MEELEELKEGDRGREKGNERGKERRDGREGNR